MQLNRIPALDGASAAASVVMSPYLRVRAIVFVEGHCEEKLFSLQFPLNRDQFVSCGGYSQVILAVNQIRQFNSTSSTSINVVGFVDKDYSESTYGDKNVAQTHYRDVEIDLYHTEAPIRLLTEKTTPSKCKKIDSIVGLAMSALEIVGKTRKYNSQLSKNWSINSINLEKCLLPHGHFDESRFLQLLFIKNNIGKDEQDQFKKWMRSNQPSLHDVIRGHDVSLVIGKWLRKKLSNRHLEETSWQCIEENLRLALRPNDLDKYEWIHLIRNHISNTTIC